MTLTVHEHPFAAYCWKVLIALYERNVPFERHLIGDEADRARLAELWPMAGMPVLVDDAARVTLPESSIIIEYLDRHGEAPALVPADPAAALRTRLWDRVIDAYVMTPMQKIVGDRLRPEADRDPFGVAEARRALEAAYRWLDEAMGGREWAAGEAFSLADCAAAPALFYADWTHPIDKAFTQVHAYRRRLLARPSFARAVDEARPYRAYFPLGAPDRD